MDDSYKYLLNQYLIRVSDKMLNRTLLFIIQIALTLVITTDLLVVTHIIQFNIQVILVILISISVGLYLSKRIFDVMIR